MSFRFESAPEANGGAPPKRQSFSPALDDRTSRRGDASGANEQHRKRDEDRLRANRRKKNRKAGGKNQEKEQGILQDLTVTDRKSSAAAFGGRQADVQRRPVSAGTLRGVSPGGGECLLAVTVSIHFW